MTNDHILGTHVHSSIIDVTVPTDLTTYTVGASLRFALPPAP